MKKILIVAGEESLIDKVKAEYNDQDCKIDTVNMKEIDMIDWFVLNYDEVVVVYDEQSKDIKFEHIINAKTYYLPAERVAQGDF